ncbi:exo-alpha-sialidase [Rothia sp. ARF10]|nr:exo-alpha-sialidase [Rothia sp. ARF10]
MLPRAHVHAVARDPLDEALLLATHEGLVRREGSNWTRVGPAIDLMGFTVVGPRHYLASGHPNMQADLPQPVGLIESTDGGRSWRVASRGGQSDFHALTMARGHVVGFDGSLRRSADRLTWTAGASPGELRTLASSPDGSTLLATTARGLMRSTDLGATWGPVADAPTLLHVVWGDGPAVVGVAPDGVVSRSDDGAATWRRTGTKVPPPQAVGAASRGGSSEVLVVTGDEVLTSLDGNDFRPVVD